MFDFKIINLSDGNQVIDRNLKTPYNVLTAVQMVEYIEVDMLLTIADRMKQEKQREQEHRRRLARNPFYRLACLCGIV
jgi:hypothetical protein